MLLGGVGWRQKVADEEDKKDQLDTGPDRVVLVARLDVSNEDGGAGDFLERLGGLVQPGDDLCLGFAGVHGNCDGERRNVR